MTQDEIIELGKQAGIKGFEYYEFASKEEKEAITTFAKLVAAKATAKEREVCGEAAMKAAEKAIDFAIKLEREACAKACEEAGTVEQWDGLSEAADRIRARGEA